MTIPSGRIRYLFKLYINNSCTASQLDELLGYLSDESGREQIEYQLRCLWQQSIKTPSVSQPDWDSLYIKMIHDAEKNKPGYPSISNFQTFKYLKVAAVLLMFLSFGYWMLKYQKEPLAPVMAAQRKEVRQTILLPDGSSVILNSESKLNYPASFTGKTREVYLTGEAWFDIKRQTDKPFLVHTQSITIKVLGTAFIVKAYPDQTNIAVTVERGKVQVLDKGRPLAVLIPNQQLNFNQKTGKTKKDDLDITSVVAWKEKDFVMDNITMGEAALLITYKYGVNIDFTDDTLKNCRFTASFLNTASLQQVLEVVGRLNNITYRQVDENTVLMSGRGCE